MSHPKYTWTLIPTPAAAVVATPTGLSTFVPGVDLALTVDGDLDVVSDLRFTTGLEAVAQGLSIRLQSFKGEWFLDLDDGVPYFERDGVLDTEALLGQRYDESKARAAFRTAILAAPGVDSLDSLTLAFDNGIREMTVSFHVTTTFGQIIVSELGV